MILSRLIPGALLALAPLCGLAVEFKTVGTAPAILYDAPSLKGGKRYIAPRGMPVEVVLGRDAWVKVRDMSGDMAWTKAASLSSRRNVIVRTANATVRAGANEGATIVMTAGKGVLLELVDPQAFSWLKVRHKDGIAGFVKATEVWGI